MAVVPHGSPPELLDIASEVSQGLAMADEIVAGDADYQGTLSGISGVVVAARQSTARAVNAVMTATYWDVGRRIVEYEQGGKDRAEYGKALLTSLSKDLSKEFGAGFSERNLQLMRKFYLEWQRPPEIDASTTPKGTSRIPQTLSAKFPLPWSHYVELLRVKDPGARDFYEREALAGGWTIRQLRRQIGTQFFERAALSKDKTQTLKKGEEQLPSDLVTPTEQIRDPLVLEFLELKDEYSESDLEEALIQSLQDFLLELGSDFAFVARQKRLRIDDTWFRVDLVFFHRALRCLVIIDLKLGEFSHADAGQMNVYLNYAEEHWTRDDENPPVGLILCSSKRESLAEYALRGLQQIRAAEYRTTLPDKRLLEKELQKKRAELEAREVPSKEEPGD